MSVDVFDMNTCFICVVSCHPKQATSMLLSQAKQFRIIKMNIERILTFK